MEREKNFLSDIGTPCVSSYMVYAIWELVPTWLKVLTWSGTFGLRASSSSWSLQNLPKMVGPILLGLENFGCKVYWFQN